jgi:hypothetical protein
MPDLSGLYRRIATADCFSRYHPGGTRRLSAVGQGESTCVQTAPPRRSTPAPGRTAWAGWLGTGRGVGCVWGGDDDGDEEEEELEGLSLSFGGVVSSFRFKDVNMYASLVVCFLLLLVYPIHFAKKKI